MKPYSLAYKLGLGFILASMLLSSCASATISVASPTPPEAPSTPSPTAPTVATSPALPSPMPTQPSANIPTAVPSGLQGDYLAAKVERIPNPQVSASDLQALEAGNQALAANLYQQLRSQPGNLFFSPYSISLALAMVYGGARGQTEQQMADALHFTLPQDQLHPAFNNLDQMLTSLSKVAPSSTATPGPGAPQGLQLNIANSIWGQKGFDFSQAYLDLLALNYGAGLRLADFSQSPEDARQEINNWVSDQTNDKIQNLFPPGSINAATRLALANAIYFKASWMFPFQPQSTQTGVFHLKDGSQVNVPMMSSHDTATAYEKGQGYQAVGLPYYGGQAEMVILLPDQGNFDAFESNLDATKIQSILSGLEGSKVNLTMPKFKVESEFNLTDVLKALGMSDAFQPDQANFSGIDGRQDLFISAIQHKAFVNVDESGTEAAAATGISVGITAVLPSPKVTIDRPFLFYIYDQQSNTILFAGRVLNPAQ